MGVVRLTLEGGGIEELRIIFINQILALKFLLQKTLGLTQEGGKEG